MTDYWSSAMHIFLGILLLTLHITAAESISSPALLGVNLGSTYITAATINGSGTFPLVFFKGSQAYIDFMHNTTNPELPLQGYHDEASSVMREVIGDIRFKASHTAGRDMRVGAILAPEHFTHEMRTLVSWSWYAVNDRVWEAVRPVSYSAIAYPENDCVDRLYNPWLPDDQGEWVLTFHQDFDYLSVSLSMVTTYLYETVSRNIAIPVLVDDITDLLQSFDEYEKYPNITTIVLSSHDDSADFEIVREALDKIGMQLWNRRKASPLELKYMAAVGAACMARQRAVFPIEDDTCNYPVGDKKESTTPFSHFEL